MRHEKQLRLRLLYGREIAMGPGKITLLHAIQETGSISAAARSMNMSYRRAWMLVATMNRCFREPLVQAAPGGLGGGGAKLTDLGLTVLKKYEAMETIAINAVDQHLKRFSKLLAEQPPDKT